MCQLKYLIINYENYKDMAKIKVYGKTQNRIALGIVHAYMIMHPKTTLEELRNVFPHSKSHHHRYRHWFLWHR